jgi:hypothetical protein
MTCDGLVTKSLSENAGTVPAEGVIGDMRVNPVAQGVLVQTYGDILSALGSASRAESSAALESTNLQAAVLKGTELRRSVSKMFRSSTVKPKFSALDTLPPLGAGAASASLSELASVTLDASKQEMEKRKNVDFVDFIGDQRQNILGLFNEQLDQRVQYQVYESLCRVYSSWPADCVLPDEVRLQLHLIVRLIAMETSPASKLARALKALCIQCKSHEQNTKLIIETLTAVCASNFVDTESQLLPSIIETTAAFAAAKPVVMETKHNYDDNEDWVKEISVPGAGGLQFVFDEETSTEQRHDFVEIYADAGRTKKLAGPFSGQKGDSSVSPFFDFLK